MTDFDKLKDTLEPIAVEELSRANSKNPQFHSPHEGYAVINEEYEEAEEALGFVKSHLHGIWMSIRQNNEGAAEDHALKTKDWALNTAAELIQVAAMCDKYMMMGGENVKREK